MFSSPSTVSCPNVKVTIYKSETNPDQGEWTLDKNRRGPQTVLAKQNVRHNAVTHGLLAVSPVIRGETEPEWQSHLAGLLESFEPVGYLETCLTESIAHLLWRLRRINRFETTALGGPVIIDLEQTDGETPDEKRKMLKNGEEALMAFEELASLNRGKVVPSDVSAPIIREILEHGLALGLDKNVDIMQTISDNTLASMTVGNFRRLLNRIAAALELGPSMNYIQGAIESMNETYSRAISELKKPGDWPLPDDDTLERIQRYEGHTHRLLMKTLHEIEALQARRLGSPAPLLRMDVDHNGL
jgi:hypothetical protein